MLSMLQIGVAAFLLTTILISNTIAAHSHPTTTPTQNGHQNPMTNSLENFESSEDELSRSEPSSEEEDDWAWYESDEDECPSNQFWHIRGKRCVPFRCPRPSWMRDSNKDLLRDPKTGECLYEKMDAEAKSFGNGDRGRTAFATRGGVLNLVKGTSGFRGRSGRIISKWKAVNQKRRVYLDENMANPVRTIGLVG